MLYRIFKTFFKIGAFTIGGGYAMIPVIQKEVVENEKWLTDEEFLDSLAVTQSMPGPLAINTAVFVGYKTAGIPGALSALLGSALPSFIIILIIASFFSKIKDYEVIEHVFAGIRPAVVSLIAFAVIKLAKSMGFSTKNIIITLATIAAIIFLDIHPIIIIILSGAAGFLTFREEEDKS